MPGIEALPLTDNQMTAVARALAALQPIDRDRFLPAVYLRPFVERVAREHRPPLLGKR
jgi:hypothetical protein